MPVASTIANKAPDIVHRAPPTGTKKHLVHGREHLLQSTAMAMGLGLGMGPWAWGWGLGLGHGAGAGTWGWDLACDWDLGLGLGALGLEWFLTEKAFNKSVGKA